MTSSLVTKGTMFHLAGLKRILEVSRTHTAMRQSSYTPGVIETWSFEIISSLGFMRLYLKTQTISGATLDQIRIKFFCSRHHHRESHHRFIGDCIWKHRCPIDNNNKKRTLYVPEGSMIVRDGDKLKAVKFYCCKRPWCFDRCETTEHEILGKE